tara:strand:- start:642 stop:767 length:126 start_codon:yes stop_codon:yes gene_type:complete
MIASVRLILINPIKNKILNNEKSLIITAHDYLSKFGLMQKR